MICKCRSWCQWPCVIIVNSNNY